MQAFKRNMLTGRGPDLIGLADADFKFDPSSITGGARAYHASLLQVAAFYREIMAMSPRELCDAPRRMWSRHLADAALARVLGNMCFQRLP